MYKEDLLSKINEVIKDELTSSIIYFRMAESLVGINIGDVVDILKEHGTEEFEHFTRILRFSYAHGLVPVINIDTHLINNSPTELMAVIKLTQELESKAIKDYKDLSLMAETQKDIETMEFFMELMKVEIEHYDELAPFAGMSREVNEEGYKTSVRAGKIRPLREVLRNIRGR